MKFAFALPAAALLTLTLTGCPGGASIHTDYDHQANFAQYHTFSFGLIDTENPLNEQRIRTAVTRDLTAKGLQLAESGGDIVVTAVGSTKNQQEYTTFYNSPGFGGYYYGGFGPGFGGVQTTTVQNYRIGTLVLDMYSAGNRQLLWRGTAQRGVASNPEQKRENLNAAIDQMLQNFPPSH